ncbi:MAG: hypothetical protein A2Z18_07920 [Armatimonadetes bacterium RBG_16_58_9]|nr:MAG: hypothetical protein A2Z18_07920 [Armatimonadetes bacterium RBG_16_58_9]
MAAAGFTTKPTPISLRNVLDVGDLTHTCHCDAVHVLGSFWPNSRTSFESRLVKCFKECIPTHKFEPHISQLIRFYADLALTRVAHEKFDLVARVLSSGETAPEGSRPLGKLVDLLCARTGARDATHLFFKSESRPPMRVVKRLSGPEAIKGRVEYVLQDLFMAPVELGANVLLVDDVYNVGASVRVYAAALKKFAQAGRVTAVNLAATRFAAGKDGHGMRRLDMTALSDRPGLAEVWVDAQSLFHVCRDCASARSPATCEVRFAAERRARPCSACVKETVERRAWWRTLFAGS